MSPERKAAIDLDEIREKRLSEISASDFLAALEAGGLTAQHLTVWPEKKKVELWTEPEDWQRFRIQDIFDVIRNEKKKVELEKDPGFERWPDPADLVINPVIYERLLGRLVKDIEARLGARYGDPSPQPSYEALVDRVATDVVARMGRR
jgi:hypothetical protein